MVCVFSSPRFYLWENCTRWWLQFKEAPGYTVQPNTKLVGFLACEAYIGTQKVCNFHCASQQGHVEISRILIDHGANLNTRMYNYWTPIHFSAYNGYLRVVELLLDRGVNTHSLDNNSQIAYQVLLQQGHRKVPDLLREHETHGG